MGLLECVFGFLTNLFTELTVHACYIYVHSPETYATNGLLKWQFPFYNTIVCVNFGLDMCASAVGCLDLYAPSLHLASAPDSPDPNKRSKL